MLAPMVDVNDESPQRSPSRRERARETRRRIRVSARALFAEHGYAGTTMAAVADAAGVAVQTVYFVFHTKGELFREVYDRAVLGDDEPVPPPETAWWRAMATVDDAEEALGHLVAGVTAISARVAPLLATVHGAAAEPEVQDVHDHSERLREEGYANVVALLDERFGLRPDVGRDRALDVLLMLLSATTYRQLVLSRGWSEAELAAWLVEVLGRELFGTR